MFIAWIRNAAKWMGREFRDVCSAVHGLKPLHWLFIAGTIAAVVFGIIRQHQAFPTSARSPFAQVSASVYTRINPSRVVLKAKVEPNASQNDRLNITVKGPHGERDPWLLVVTCGRRVPGSVGMQSIGVTSAQAVPVLASVYDVGYRSIPLPCVSAAKPVVTPGEDINLSLPVLEQGSVGPSAVADTPLYVLRGTSAGHRIERVLEVFQAPESSCPLPGTSLSASPPATGTGAPAASASAGATAAPASAGCYTQLSAGSAATKYSFPASVTTSETLEQVSLSGDRIDSMFPPGQITSGDSIVWQGASGLSPSLSASSLAGAENASRDGFYAGLAYGLAAGLFVPFLQGLSESHDRVRGARKARERAAEQPQGKQMSEAAP